MSTEGIIGIITALGTLIGTIWGIIKYYDQKSAKNRKSELEEIIAPLSSTVEKLEQANQKRTNQIEFLNKKIEKLEIVTAEQGEMIRDNEMNRLQTTIMDFAKELRQGLRQTQNRYNYIFHAYDRYKSLGGNSFVDAEMVFIKEEYSKFEKELQELSDVKNYK